MEVISALRADIQAQRSLEKAEQVSLLGRVEQLRRFAGGTDDVVASMNILLAQEEHEVT